MSILRTIWNKLKRSKNNWVENFRTQPIETIILAILSLTLIGIPLVLSYIYLKNKKSKPIQQPANADNNEQEIDSPEIEMDELETESKEIKQVEERCFLPQSTFLQVSEMIDLNKLISKSGLKGYKKNETLSKLQYELKKYENILLSYTVFANTSGLINVSDKIAKSNTFTKAEAEWITRFTKNAREILENNSPSSHSHQEKKKRITQDIKNIISLLDSALASFIEKNKEHAQAGITVEEYSSCLRKHQEYLDINWLVLKEISFIFSISLQPLEHALTQQSQRLEESITAYQKLIASTALLPRPLSETSGQSHPHLNQFQIEIDSIQNLINKLEHETRLYNVEPLLVREENPRAFSEVKTPQEVKTVNRNILKIKAKKPSQLKIKMQQLNFLPPIKEEKEEIISSSYRNSSSV